MKPAGAWPGAQPQLVVAESHLTNGGLGPGGGGAGTQVRPSTTSDANIEQQSDNGAFQGFRSATITEFWKLFLG